MSPLTRLRSLNRADTRLLRAGLDSSRPSGCGVRNGRYANDVVETSSKVYPAVRPTIADDELILLEAASVRGRFRWAASARFCRRSRMPKPQTAPAQHPEV